MTELNPVYKCAALVMFPKKRQLSIMLSLGGAKWALEELEKSKLEGPSNENWKIIAFLAQQQRKDVMTTITKTVIEWNDATVWGGIVRLWPKFFLGQGEYTDLCDGWRVFGFDGVRPV
jgi:hypothetical protein